MLISNTVSLICSCPSSAMILFESQSSNYRILHTGDFRAPINHPLLEKPFDLVYLDTTYLDPKYKFPPQHTVLETMCREAQDIISEETKGSKQQQWFRSFFNASSTTKKRVLFAVGSYTIGKERVFKGVFLRAKRDRTSKAFKLQNLCRCEKKSHSFVLRM